MTDGMLQTTFRQLLKVPNIDIGLGAYKWHVYEDHIEFECIEYGGKFSFGLDTVLDVVDWQDSSAVYGNQVDGKKDGMTVAIKRSLTLDDLK